MKQIYINEKKNITVVKWTIKMVIAEIKKNNKRS
jgi:hypothetical protein